MRKCRQSRAMLSAAVTATLSCLCSSRSYGALTPITLTQGSFNYNTVVTGGTPGSSATITGGNAGTVDTENGISFWASSYNSSGALPAAGSPFSSTVNPSTSFQFQPYTGNNTLLINADQAYASSSTPPFFAAPYSQTGTLTLASPGTYSSLAVLYTMAGQNYYGTVPPVGYTLNFSDGTSYNNGGTATLATHNWSDTTDAIALEADRVWAAGSNLGKTSGGLFSLHEADITVPVADQSEVLTSISFFDSGSGSYSNSASWPNQPNSLAIYGLSGAASVPEPLSGGMLAATAVAMMLRRRRVAADRSVI